MTAWKTLAQAYNQAAKYARASAERGNASQWPLARDFYTRTRDKWLSIQKSSGTLPPPEAKQLAAAEQGLQHAQAALARSAL